MKWILLNSYFNLLRKVLFENQVIFISFIEDEEIANLKKNYEVLVEETKKEYEEQLILKD